MRFLYFKRLGIQRTKVVNNMNIISYTALLII